MDNEKDCSMYTEHIDSGKRKVTLSMTVNGRPVVRDVDPNMTLLHFLRDNLTLTLGTRLDHHDKFGTHNSPRAYLVYHPAADWTLQRLWHALYISRLDRAELQAIATLDILAEGWRRHAQRRLDSGRVEDWSPRLDGTP